jgi:hypothetical protein
MTYIWRIRVSLVFLLTIITNASDIDTLDDKRKAAIHFQEDLKVDYHADLYRDPKNGDYYILIDQIKENHSYFWHCLYGYDKGWYNVLFFKVDHEDKKYVLCLNKCLFSDKEGKNWWDEVTFYNRPTRYFEFELLTGSHK